MVSAALRQFFFPLCMKAAPRMDLFPPLRPELAIEPMEQGGESFFVIRDSAGYAPSDLVLTPAALFVLHLFDGERTRDAIKAAFQEETGAVLDDRDMDEIRAAADGACILDSDAFYQRAHVVDESFRRNPVRLPACAGAVYAADPAELRSHICEMIEKAPAPECAPTGTGTPSAIIAPHVDYQRGYNAYGQLYRELATRPAPETVVILGTAHEGASTPLVLTQKDFITPFGTMHADGDLVRRLADGLPFDPFHDEPRHRNEHSVELQLPFLQHIWGAGVRIVPVLCGSLFEWRGGRLSRANDAWRREFCDRLRMEARARGERLLIMASADLSHVGPVFGDDIDSVDEVIRAGVMDMDRRLLMAALGGSANGIVALLEEGGNPTHICGGACIHAMLLSNGLSNGTLMGYHQAPAEDGSQMVTFASVIYERNAEGTAGR